ncbi:MAG: peptidoglycan DD-metalloendopeptidase family protein [Proteobacteria bacterium]|nr:peptidoglycan DD-metalloendopeptidase family protein [Pseudomonadota bacterium]
MIRRYWLLLIFLIGCPLHAEDTEQEFSDLKKQEIQLLLEKRRLTEAITVFQKNLEELSHMKAEREENIVKKRQEIEKKLPLIARLGRTNPLRVLVDASTGKNTLRGITLIRAFSTSLKRQLLELQVELDQIATFSSDLLEKRQSHAQLLQDVDFQHEQVVAFQKKLMGYMTQAELERLKDEEDVNVLLDESRAIFSKKRTKAKAASAEKGLPFRWLEHPVVGNILDDLELQNKFSPNGQGIIFETKMNAEVLSPSEGTVVFKGPFKSQGDILIIDHGQKVHTVFMGIHKIDAEVGQNVYAGQKLGTMAGYGAKSPKLYLELRHEGKAIDPHPYFVE